MADRKSSVLPNNLQVFAGGKRRPGPGIIAALNDLEGCCGDPISVQVDRLPDRLGFDNGNSHVNPLGGNYLWESVLLEQQDETFALLQQGKSLSVLCTPSAHIPVAVNIKVLRAPKGTLKVFFRNKSDNDNTVLAKKNWKIWKDTLTVVSCNDVAHNIETTDIEANNNLSVSIPTVGDNESVHSIYASLIAKEMTPIWIPDEVAISFTPETGVEAILNRHTFQVEVGYTYIALTAMQNLGPQM